eukprot:1158775-Pelagomonas_calceolata.AAC.3
MSYAAYFKTMQMPVPKGLGVALGLYGETCQCLLDQPGLKDSNSMHALHDGMIQERVSFVAFPAPVLCACPIKAFTLHGLQRAVLLHIKNHQ